MDLINGMEWNIIEWNGMLVTFFGSNIRRNGNESFYNNITIIPFIFIKWRINL